MIFKPLEVKALDNYKIWIKYDDGVSGEIDLSDLAGKGVFAIWNDYSEFKKVHIAGHGAIAWNDEIDLCSDSLYLRLTRKSPEELFPALRTEKIDA